MGWYSLLVEVGEVVLGPKRYVSDFEAHMWFRDFVGKTHLSCIVDILAVFVWFIAFE